MFGTWASMFCFIAILIVGARPETLTIFSVLFILQGCMFGITNNIQNPMIADCADYEEYRVGKAMPGVVGTVFTFVDKLVSSLSTTIVGFALAFAGVSKGQLPTDTYISDKFYWTVLICFCIIPILGHLATIISMKFYPLTKEKMEEIQQELQKRRQETIKTS